MYYVNEKIKNTYRVPQPEGRGMLLSQMEARWAWDISLKFSENPGKIFFA